MNNQKLAGSLREFIDFPDHRSAFRMKAISQGTPVSQNNRPFIQRKGFDLSQHTKNNNNLAMLEVMKARRMQQQSKSRSKRQHQSIEAESVISRMNKTEHSFFTKNDMKIDTLNKLTLNKKHLLLKSIIKTQEEQNKFKGSSIYDESFKRLYHGLQKLYIQPILNKQPIIVDEDDLQKDSIRPSKNDFQPIKTRLSAKLRLRLENCRNWAKIHNKSTSFYNHELDGKPQETKSLHQPLKRQHIRESIKHLLK